MSTALRTDPHPPGTLRPENYTFLTAFDNEPERDCDRYLGDPERHSLATGIATQIGQGPAIAGYWRTRLAACTSPAADWNSTGGGRCGHCGAHIRYVVVLRHEPTGQLLPVSQTCLDNRLGDDPATYVGLLRDVTAARCERIGWQILRTEWLGADPRHLQAITYLHARVKDEHRPVPPFAGEAARLWDQPSTTALTARQVTTLLSMRDRDAAQRRDQKQQDTQAPEGRTEVSGTVVSVRERPGFRNGPVIKLIVRDDRGFAVWVTRTDALCRELGWDTSAYQDFRLTFTATLTRSSRDSSLAFARRVAHLTAQAPRIAAA